MAETDVVTPEVKTEEPAPVNIQLSPFGGNAWSEKLPEPKKEEPATALPATSAPAAVATEPKKEEAVSVDDDEVYKREFGKTKQEFTTEYTELKKLKETPQQFKFENEESKALAEAIAKGDRKAVVKILETQDKLESYTTAEVSKETADDIIKLAMQLKYKDLTQKEIDYKFNKEFSIPKAPVQTADELDDDFDVRKAEWQEKVNDIETMKIIEAKLAKPELEKLKSQIVLPNISTHTSEQPSQESLAKMEEIRNNFLKKLESDYAKADGFSTKVKDESVELPVSFKIPDEAKLAIKERFKAGFDLNGFIAQRWDDANGSAKIEQIVSDIYVLENLDKILSGIANNGANERLTHYQKSLKNIDLNGKTHQEIFNPEQNGKQVSPFAKDAWSEALPTRNN